MENNTLSNNRKASAIIKWSARKYRALSIAYWSMLFISFPLIELFMFIVLASNGRSGSYSSAMAQVEGTLTTAGSIPGVFFAGAAVVFSTVIALIAFSYLHNKRIIDFFGSMPVSRRTMFFARYIYVLGASIIPVIIFGLIGMVLTFNGTAMLSVLKTLGFIILGIVGNVSIIAFISVCCGTIADAIVTYAVLNIIWPVCVFICYYFPFSVIPGLEEGYLWDSIFTLFCPMAAFFTGIFGDGQLLHLVWWIGLSIVLTLGCYKLSKKRKAEMAQNTYYFAAVEVVIKFITCFVSGFGIGWIMSHLQGDKQSIIYQYIWFFVGMVIGVMVANILLHLIFHRGLSKYKGSLMECGVVSVAVVCFLIIVTSGGFGYDSRIPKSDDVAKVNIKPQHGDEFYINGVDCLSFMSDDAEKINAAVKYQKKIIEEQKQKKKKGLYPIFSYEYFGEESLKIKYFLKDGSVMERCYDGISVKIPKELKDRENIKIRAINNIPAKYLASVYVEDKGYNIIDSWNYESEERYKADRKEVIEKGSQLIDAIKKDIAAKGLVKSEDKAKNIVELYYDSGAPDYSYFSTEIYISKEYTNTLKVIAELTKNTNKSYNYLLDSPICAEYRDYMIHTEVVREVYFKVPDTWNPNEVISCMLVNSKLVKERVEEDGKVVSVQAATEEEPALFTGIGTKFSECERVSDNIWKYSIRDISDFSDDYNRVMFYQKSGNKLHCTGGIALPDNKSDNLLVVTENKDKDEQIINSTFAGPMCDDYKWEKYSE